MPAAIVKETRLQTPPPQQHPQTKNGAQLWARGAIMVQGLAGIFEFISNGTLKTAEQAIFHSFFACVRNPTFRRLQGITASMGSRRVSPFADRTWRRGKKCASENLAKVCNLTNDGKQSILAFAEPGELFGELAIFDSEQRDEYVEAVEKSTVVMIPANELQELVAANHDVSIALTKMIGLRRHRVERRLKNLLFLSNRDRLIHLLLDLAEQFGIDDSDGIRLRIKLAHQEIANLMGSTRETVTILLGQLKSEGWVQVGRQRIVLIQVEQMAMSVHRKTPRLVS